jgi:hypothetical protein
MNATTIIDALGGVKATAKLAGCTTQRVYQWRTVGEIPDKPLRILKLVRPKVFRKLDLLADLPSRAVPDEPVDLVQGESQ